MNHPHVPRGASRRELLAAGALLAAAASPPARALAAIAPRPAPAAAPRTRQVLLVVLGGGVRTRETLLSDNTPNLRRLADEGVLYPRVRAENVGHYGATASIFTGVTESFGIRENDRAPHPTLFEYVRKGAGLTASEVWLSTSGGEQETNYSHGTDPRWGARWGANLIGGEGLFNAQLRELLGAGGGLGKGDPAADERLARLRAAVRTPLPADGAGPGNDAQAAARIEGYILDELRGGTSAITGLGANDAKALRVARNLLAIFRPRLLAVTLRNADVAHGSINDYVQVIRRNDDELGRLLDAVRGDEALRDSTAVLVLPEFGRDRDLNLRRGLDHGDDSRELHEVALVAWGPDFRRGRVVDHEVRTLDVAPTVAGLFGVDAPVARGTRLPGLMA